MIRRWLEIKKRFRYSSRETSSSSSSSPRPQPIPSTVISTLLALEALHGSFSAPHQLTGWRATGGDPCGGEQWRGVSCSNSSVVSVNIRGLGVGGFLPSNISTLFSLKELDVSCNNIGGEIPSALPPNATHMNFATNKFMGNIPPTLALLKFLKNLNISSNTLSGPIGNVFMDMRSLETLDLSFNYFNGDLPSSFGSLTNLHSVYLQNNEFTGSVTLLANLPLFVLNIENNHFSGYVPKQFKSIPQLRIKGNLFQPGFGYAPNMMNGSTQSPLSSADKSVSHTPKVTQSSFDYSSLQVGNWHHKKLGLGLIATVVGVLFVVAIISAAVFMINTYRFHNESEHSKSSADSVHSSPIIRPAVPLVNLDQFPRVSPPMTSTQPPPTYELKPERMCRSSVRRSRNLLTLKLYSAADLLKATENYSEEHLLGEGFIGRVYRAEFPDGQILAVKKIDMGELALYKEEEFLDVIWNMSCLKHPNISILLGYCVDQGEHIIVYEYAKGGSLDDLLFPTSGKFKALSWKARVRIALGVAYALEYIHWICSPPVAHGNIKATNILLDNELMPHLSDCGLTVLSHLVSTSRKASEMLISSNGYAAPELCIPGVDKTKSDVYSFGVVLLELLIGKRAYDSSRKKEELFLVSWASSRLHDLNSLEGITDPKIRGTIPPKALSRLADIILLCIQPLPEFRPPMTEITEKLIHLAQKVGKHNKPSSEKRSEFDGSDLSFRSTHAHFYPSASSSR
ncbi:protein STRUBBELIG-RECEPTOR FAMILY 8-like isoform X1 [Typha latifolia]|uniref:protein STRUBBELIG-RECEPTOR FAMILY 8-like isoform X1 n=1 Tax=Typha latifolia TaxID=4733 RepID=UPI003C2F1798